MKCYNSLECCFLGAFSRYPFQFFCAEPRHKRISNAHERSELAKQSGLGKYRTTFRYYCWFVTKLSSIFGIAQNHSTYKTSFPLKLLSQFVFGSLMAYVFYVPMSRFYIFQFFAECGYPALSSFWLTNSSFTLHAANLS